ncbi:YjbF family lipoprotein [Celeribacter litoreus]|uniref:YjbF family lipoprotein n=1 Tax=Celeribacter litoreus TaxID=2876714 RepID=UPI001CCFF3D4|nr:YjbF family lipoprotein [Celeribacter litoreus]MCA0044090.1 YjbF family lipoprotein [Celeribacter litoreus]
MKTSTLLLSLFSALLVAACSSDPNQTSRVLQYLSGPEIPEVDPEFVSLVEAGEPTMILAVANRENAFSAFSRKTTNNKGEEIWISGDNLSLATKGGMIVGTRGFLGDALAIDASQSLAVLRAGSSGIVDRFVTVLNGEDHAETFAFKCKIERAEVWPIDFGDGISIQTRAYSESCRNRDTEFRNVYWASLANGEIVQSSQWIGPESGSVTIRILTR